MKKLLLPLLMLCVCSVVNATSYTSSLNDQLDWQFNTDDGLLLLVWKNNKKPRYEAKVVFDGLKKIKTVDGKVLNLHEQTIALLLPEGLRHMPDPSDFVNLKWINVPTSMEYFSPYKFRNCPKLEYIYVAEGHPTYITIQEGTNSEREFPPTAGVVYTKDTTEVICCPKALTGRVILHPNVTRLHEHAFHGCAKMRSVFTPKKTPSSGPAQIEVMGESCFEGCSMLFTLHNMDIVCNVAEAAFKNCAELLDVDLQCKEIGRSAFVNCAKLSSIRFPDSLTFIDDYAFSNCTSLRLARIPRSVQHIGLDAFRNTALPADKDGCVYSEKCLVAVSKEVQKTLRSVTVKDGTRLMAEYCFFDCEQLEEVVLPSSLQSIPHMAFSGCQKLKNIAIPSSVRHIGSGAFYLHCPAVEEDHGVFYVGNCLIDTNMPYVPKEYTVRAGTRLIADRAFAPTLVRRKSGYDFLLDFLENYEKVTTIERINLPYTLEVIGNEAFYEAKKLTTINLEMVESIGDKAFYECINLSAIYFGMYLKHIGQDVLYHCKNLKTVYWDVPSYDDFTYSCTPFHREFYNVNNRKVVAFDIRKGIEDFTFGPNVRSIPSYLCDGLENVKHYFLPFSVQKVGYGAFLHSGSDELMRTNKLLIRVPQTTQGKYKIPKGITTICSHAFHNCTGITEIVFPKGLTTIENEACMLCKGLTSLSFPATVNYIGVRAFMMCSSLKTIKFTSKTPPFLGEGCFAYCPENIEVKHPHNKNW